MDCVKTKPMTIKHEYINNYVTKNHNCVLVLNTIAVGALTVRNYLKSQNVKSTECKNYYGKSSVIIYVGQWRVKQKETKN